LVLSPRVIRVDVILQTECWPAPGIRRGVLRESIRRTAGKLIRGGFMDPQQLLLTAARGFGVFIIMLVVIRLLGKRTIGNFTAFDLLVALMLGEVVDEIIYGDVNLAQGAVAILVVAAAKYATSWLSYGNRDLNRILEGIPTPVLVNGELQRDALRKELMNEKEVLAALRMEGIDDMREVKLASLEVDGTISVIKHDWAEPVQKSDLESGAKGKERAEQDEPPEDKRTDTPRALGQKD
jgi:uncharacterized membrane protein YcaP (DUF421 family)